jgi:hypothetical protein
MKPTLGKIARRLADLEKRLAAGPPVLVWCDKPADIPAKADAMVAAGKMSKADRARVQFIHWKWDEDDMAGPR